MARTAKPNGGNGARLNGPQSVNAAIWSICDVLRRSNCAGALQYVPELTWILFLRVLDSMEAREEDEAAAVGDTFLPSLPSPYRWRDWAAPDGAKRKELAAGKLGEFFGFVNGELIPRLKKFANDPNATSRQKVIGEALSGLERTRVDTERNFLDVLDRVHRLDLAGADEQHMFVLSQAYEGLLLRMGEKGNDGGQFFTPREIIRAVVAAVAPKPGETIYDPCCGTGGFLAEAMKHISADLGAKATPDAIERLKTRTFFGREKENLVYPIALSNLIIHGIDRPHIWHGNALTGQEVYGGLYQGAPDLFDVILTNPPFGGKEGKEAQAQFTFKTRATQILFLQHVIDRLKPGGRCGMVVDEGVLFRNNEGAFVGAKRKLLDSCEVNAIVSLPPGAFVNAGAGVKTNLLFFRKGEPTEAIWYYDLSDVKVGKRNPLTLANFDEFFRLLPTKSDSDRSWTVRRAEFEAKNYDLKAVNPHRKRDIDTRTPGEILAEIERLGREADNAIAELKRLMN